MNIWVVLKLWGVKLCAFSPKPVFWPDSPASCGWTPGWWHCRVFLFLMAASRSSVATEPLTSRFLSGCSRPSRLQCVDYLQLKKGSTSETTVIKSKFTVRKYTKYSLCVISIISSKMASNYSPTNTGFMRKTLILKLLFIGHHIHKHWQICKKAISS